MTETITIPRLNMETVKPWGVIFLIGHNDAGKSTMVKEILNAVGIGGVIVTNEIDFKKYAHLESVQRLYTTYSPDVLTEFLRIQRWPNPHPRYLVLDHCLYDTRWTRDKHMRALFTEAQELRTLLIITMQYPIWVSHTILAGVDYACIFRENYVSNRTKLYDMYCSTLLTKEQFHSAMNWIGGHEYSCLVVDRSRRTERVCWHQTVSPTNTVEEYYKDAGGEAETNNKIE